MSIDLKALSTKQLDTLISKARKLKTNLAKRKPAATVRRKITALAKSEGYTIDELFGTGAGTAKATSPRRGRKLGKVPPKYRNPANKAETWTGRGKQPRWLAAEVAKGKSSGFVPDQGVGDAEDSGQKDQGTQGRSEERPRRARPASEDRGTNRPNNEDAGASRRFSLSLFRDKSRGTGSAPGIVILAQRRICCFSCLLQERLQPRGLGQRKGSG